MVERRGQRPSKASKAAFEVVPMIPGEDKPSPPEDMSGPEQEVWRSVVNAMPLRWFGRETWPMLRGLCRHTVAAEIVWERYLAALNSEREPDDIDALSRWYTRETDAINRASDKLRLTKSMRSQPVVAERAKQNQTLRRPWE